MSRRPPPNKLHSTPRGDPATNFSLRFLAPGMIREAILAPARLQRDAADAARADVVARLRALTTRLNELPLGERRALSSRPPGPLIGVKKRNRPHRMSYVAPAATSDRMLHEGAASAALRDPAPSPPAEPCPRCHGTDWTRHVPASRGRWWCHTCWSKGRYDTGGPSRRRALMKGDPMPGHVAFDPDNNPEHAEYLRTFRPPP